MKLRILSDMHLDFASFDVDLLDVKKDEVFVLAGDLGEQTTGSKFVGEIAKRAKHVIYVMGNHEYYAGKFENTVKKIREGISRLNPQVFRKVTVTERDTIKIDDVHFVCATKWTDFLNCNPITMQEAKTYMMDYNWIQKIDGGLLQPMDVYQRYTEDVEFIQKEVAARPNEKVVVVTHHAPSGQSVGEQFIGSRVNPFFHSSQEDIMHTNPNIVLWVHGHMHNRSDYVVNQTRVVCNPRGYTRKSDFNGQENMEFDPYFMVEI